MLISDISFAYNNGNNVFNNLSFEIPENQIVSLVGKSGCGKSTLLNLISGLDKCKTGSISLSSSDIAYLTQKPTLLSYRNSFENAILGLELRNTLNSKSKSEIDSLFSLFGLAEAKNKYPQELSGGMLQLIGIIQTILIDSEIYLLDEPYTAIDRNTLLKVESFVWDLFRRKKSTVIMISHDLEKAISLGDRVVMLSSNPGSIVFDLEFAPDFIKETPIARKSTSLYSEYLLQVVKQFSEL